MADNTADVTATATGGATSREEIRAVISRVISLSIFFVGIGMFAAIGYALHQLALFGEYQVTYFAVGVAVGVVGVLLWLVAR